MNRIVVDPRIMMGRPVIRGTRIPVNLVVNLVAEGYTQNQIIKEYPDLTEPDIQAALKFVARLANFEEVRAAV